MIWVKHSFVKQTLFLQNSAGNAVLPAIWHWGLFYKTNSQVCGVTHLTTILDYSIRTALLDIHDLLESNLILSWAVVRCSQHIGHDWNKCHEKIVSSTIPSHCNRILCADDWIKKTNPHFITWSSCSYHPIMGRCSHQKCNNYYHGFSLGYKPVLTGMITDGGLTAGIQCCACNYQVRLSFSVKVYQLCSIPTLSCTYWLTTITCRSTSTLLASILFVVIST